MCDKKRPIYPKTEKTLLCRNLFSNTAILSKMKILIVLVINEKVKHEKKFRQNITNAPV